MREPPPKKAFGLAIDPLANCVIVRDKREGIERIAACLVLATTRADVNNVVKRLLDVGQPESVGCLW